MKKTIIAGIVLGLSLMGASASIDVNLKYGMKNDSVIELQDFLIDRGLLTGNSTGFFGLMTLKAVKTYQISQNLPSTGYVGAMTRSSINAQIALDTASSTEQASLEDPTSTSPTPTGSAPQEIVQSPAVQQVSVPIVSTPAPANPYDGWSVKYVIQEPGASSSPVWLYILDKNGNWQTGKVTIDVRSSFGPDGSFLKGVDYVQHSGPYTGAYRLGYSKQPWKEDWMEISIPELNYVKKIDY